MAETPLTYEETPIEHQPRVEATEFRDGDGFDLHKHGEHVAPYGKQSEALGQAALSEQPRSNEQLPTPGERISACSKGIVYMRNAEQYDLAA